MIEKVLIQIEQLDFLNLYCEKMHLLLSHVLRVHGSQYVLLAPRGMNPVLSSSCYQGKE